MRRTVLLLLLAAGVLVPTAQASSEPGSGGHSCTVHVKVQQYVDGYHWCRMGLRLETGRVVTFAVSASAAYRGGALVHVCGRPVGAHRCYPDITLELDLVRRSNVTRSMWLPSRDYLVQLTPAPRAVPLRSFEVDPPGPAVCWYPWLGYRCLGDPVAAPAEAGIPTYGKLTLRTSY